MPESPKYRHFRELHLSAARPRRLEQGVGAQFSELWENKSMRTWFAVLLVLIAAGLIFSGYLSATKLVSGSCAFNEPCPYFLGYPACWYGFAFYFAMFVATLLARFRRVRLVSALRVDAVISLIGIVFAGSFVVGELSRSAVTGMLGLSTCTYGLIFYVAIFAVALMALGKART